MSRDHNTNLVVTMLMAFAICFVVGLIVGLPALRFSGVYLALVNLCARGLDPADPAAVLDVPRRRRWRLISEDQTSATSGSTSRPGRARRSSSRSRGCFCAAASGGRSARSATARSRPWRPGSSCPSTRRSPSGSRPPSPGSRDRCSCWRRTALRARSEFGVFLSLQTPHRRGRGGARLALGSPCGRGLRRAPARGLDAACR